MQVGQPQFLHIHCKTSLPSTIQTNTIYTLQFILMNELDIYDSQIIKHKQSNDIQPLVVDISIVNHELNNNNSNNSNNISTIHISNKTKPIFNVNIGLLTIDVTFNLHSHTFTNHNRLLVKVQSHYAVQYILPYISHEFTITNRNVQHNKNIIQQQQQQQSLITVQTTKQHIISLYTNNIQPYVIISEYSGSYIGCRIWDCGLLLLHYLQYYNILTNELDSNAIFNNIINIFCNKNIIEIGSGTGIVGIYLYIHTLLINIKQQSNHNNNSNKTNYVLTDIDECIDLLKHNCNGNKQLFNHINDDSTTSVSVNLLQYGNNEHYDTLPIQKYDIIVGSDILFNPVLFDDLIDTIQLLSHSTTQLLISYRIRDSYASDDKLFFKRMKMLQWTTNMLKQYNNVYILLLTHNKSS